MKEKYRTTTQDNIFEQFLSKVGVLNRKNRLKGRISYSRLFLHATQGGVEEDLGACGQECLRDFNNCRIGHFKQDLAFTFSFCGLCPYSVSVRGCHQTLGVRVDGIRIAGGRNQRMNIRSHFIRCDPDTLVNEGKGGRFCEIGKTEKRYRQLKRDKTVP